MAVLSVLTTANLATTPEAMMTPLEVASVDVDVDEVVLVDEAASIHAVAVAAEAVAVVLPEVVEALLIVVASVTTVAGRPLSRDGNHEAHTSSGTADVGSGNTLSHSRLYGNQRCGGICLTSYSMIPTNVVSYVCDDGYMAFKEGWD